MKLVVLALMLPFLLPIIAVVILIMYLIMKGKSEGWKGTIIDKSHNSKRDDDHKRLEHFYSFTIRTTDGKERKVAVASQLYAECDVGDIIEKPKGAMFPKKVLT